MLSQLVIKRARKWKKKERQNPLHYFVCFQMPKKNNIRPEVLIFGVINYSTHSLKNYVTSEKDVSHNVLYYQQLSIAHYQVRFFMLKIILCNSKSVQFLSSPTNE